MICVKEGFLNLLHLYPLLNGEIMIKPISFQVHLCEAVNVGDYLQDDYLTNRTISRPVLVAVKMLRKDADDRARYSYFKASAWLAQLVVHSVYLWWGFAGTIPEFGTFFH